MKAEDKDLLLKDLCARLPYGVKATTTSMWNDIYTITGYANDRIYLDCPVYDKGDDEWLVESVRPYLRPMSSMTEDEKIEWDAEYAYNSKSYKYEEYLSKMIDWLNAHHFDYRGLIDKGLAIKVTKENNPYEKH